MASNVMGGTSGWKKHQHKHHMVQKAQGSSSSNWYAMCLQVLGTLTDDSPGTGSTPGHRQQFVNAVERGSSQLSQAQDNRAARVGFPHITRQESPLSATSIDRTRRGLTHAQPSPIPKTEFRYNRKSMMTITSFLWVNQGPRHKPHHYILLGLRGHELTERQNDA